MKKYVDNFLQYRFLLSELVLQKIINVFFHVGTIAYNDRTYHCVWYLIWKYRQDISGVYSDRTIVVQLLFTGNKGGIEIYQTEFGDDQESLCAEIFISLVQCAF